MFRHDSVMRRPSVSAMIQQMRFCGSFESCMERSALLWLVVSTNDRKWLTGEAVESGDPTDDLINRFHDYYWLRSNILMLTHARITLPSRSVRVRQSGQLPMFVCVLPSVCLSCCFSVCLSENAGWNCWHVKREAIHVNVTMSYDRLEPCAGRAPP